MDSEFGAAIAAAREAKERQLAEEAEAKRLAEEEAAAETGRRQAAAVRGQKDELDSSVSNLHGALTDSAVHAQEIMKARKAYEENREFLKEEFGIKSFAEALKHPDFAEQGGKILDPLPEQKARFGEALAGIHKAAPDIPVQLGREVRENTMTALLGRSAELSKQLGEETAKTPEGLKQIEEVLGNSVKQAFASREFNNTGLDFLKDSNGILYQGRAQRPLFALRNPHSYGVSIGEHPEARILADGGYHAVSEAAREGVDKNLPSAVEYLAITRSMDKEALTAAYELKADHERFQRAHWRYQEAMRDLSVFLQLSFYAQVEGQQMPEVTWQYHGEDDEGDKLTRFKQYLDQAQDFDQIFSNLNAGSPATASELDYRKEIMRQLLNGTGMRVAEGETVEAIVEEITKNLASGEPQSHPGLPSRIESRLNSSSEQIKGDDASLKFPGRMPDLRQSAELLERLTQFLKEAPRRLIAAGQQPEQYTLKNVGPDEGKINLAFLKSGEMFGRLKPKTSILAGKSLKATLQDGEQLKYAIGYRERVSQVMQAMADRDALTFAIDNLGLSVEQAKLEIHTQEFWQKNRSAGEALSHQVSELRAEINRLGAAEMRIDVKTRWVGDESEAVFSLPEFERQQSELAKLNDRIRTLTDAVEELARIINGQKGTTFHFPDIQSELEVLKTTNKKKWWGGDSPKWSTAMEAVANYKIKKEAELQQSQAAREEGQQKLQGSRGVLEQMRTLNPMLVARVSRSIQAVSIGDYLTELERAVNQKLHERPNPNAQKVIDLDQQRQAKVNHVAEVIQQEFGAPAGRNS